MNDILTVKQVAKELQFSEQTIKNWIKEGKLLAFKPSEKEIRIKKTDLEKFIEERLTTQPV